MLKCVNDTTQNNGSNEIVDNEKNKKLAQLCAAMELHINCQKMEAIIKHIDDVNYKIPSNDFFASKMPKYVGMTALHLALEKSNLDVFNLLIKRGADYTIKNNNKSTVLHEVLNERNFYRDYLERDLNYGLFTHQLESVFADSVLSAHINFNNSTNPCDDNGVSHFHIARLLNKVEAAEFFLKNGVSIDKAIHKDSSVLPGFTPLHIAVKFWASGVVDLLLKHNANQHLKNATGMSPLHVLVEERLKLWFCVTMRRRLNRGAAILRSNFQTNKRMIGYLLNGREVYDGSLIDMIRTSQTEHPDTVTILDPKITDDIGLSHFHAACTFQNVCLIEKLLKQVDDVNRAVNLDSPFLSGYTALHFASHFDLETVKLLIKHGADLESVDAEGLTPFEICLQRFRAEEICSILNLRADWLNILFSDNKTKLFDFIYAMRNENAFEEFLKSEVIDINTFVPLDSPLAAGLTPLHFAIMATEIAKTNLPHSENADYSASSLKINRVPVETSMYHRRIHSCLKHGADVTRRDARGSTPLHRAFRLRENVAAVQLLQYHPEKVNPDHDGVTHFHIACALSDDAFIEIFLSDSKDIANRPVASSFSCSYSKDDVSVYFFMKKGSTPLHIAAAIDSVGLAEVLMKYDADTSAKDEDGLTPWDLALKLYESKKFCFPKFIVKTTVRLLTKGEADAVAKKYEDRIPLRGILNDCDDLVKHKLFLEFGNNEAIQRCVLDDMGITMLHVACAVGDIDEARNLLIQGADVNARVRLDSPVWPGCTPINIFVHPQSFSHLIDDCYAEFVALLLDYEADVTIQDARRSSPVHEMFEYFSVKDEPYRTLKMRTDIINGYELGIKTNKKFYFNSYLELLVKAQTEYDVNPVSVRGISHFHVACAINDVKTVKKFLERGVDVNDKTHCFNDKLWGAYSSLHFAARYCSKDTIDLLLEHGADVHSTDIFADTPLHIFVRYSSSNDDLEHIIESLVRYGADINAENLAGKTPLELSFEHKIATDRLLVALKKHGCRFNAINRITGEGCISMALYPMRVPVVETVLSILEIDDLDEMGRTAMHNVMSTLDIYNGEVPDGNTIENIPICSEVYCKAITKLAKLGLDIDQQDSKGMTALHVATQRRNYTGVRTLLANGADINIIDKNGRSAFAYCAEMSEDERTEIDNEILKVLSKHVYKLYLINMTVVKSNEDAFLKTFENQRWYLSREHEELYDELLRLESKLNSMDTIFLSYTLYEKGLVIDYPAMIKQDRDFVDEFFENAESLRQEFPEFFSLLLLQYKKGVARVELIRLADISFSCLVDIELPYLCTEAIFQFLSNDELKNVIVSCSLD